MVLVYHQPILTPVRAGQIAVRQPVVMDVSRRLGVIVMRWQGRADQDSGPAQGQGCVCMSRQQGNIVVPRGVGRMRGRVVSIRVQAGDGIIKQHFEAMIKFPNHLTV